MNENKLDQFYTKDEISLKCVEKFKTMFDTSNNFYIEPSAGGGSFVRALSDEDMYCCDIEPHCDGIDTVDFLTSDISNKIPTNKNIVVLGNPPFGKRSKTALEFIDKAFSYAKVVGFILPVQFRKYLTQKQIRQDACLVMDIDLPKDSFTHNGKSYGVRCCFQVWELNSEKPDLRIREKPSTTHPDFEMWQYNNTKQALKYFDRNKYPWDFAVVRQGYYDYTKKYYPDDVLDTKKQWIFFKANTPDVLKKLLSINYDALSLKNTSVRGFGKADVVEEYNRLG